MRSSPDCCRTSAIFALLVWLLMWSGCADSRPPLRVGFNPWVGYEPLPLARSLGALDGKQVDLVSFPSTTEVIRAYRYGVIDVAAVTMDEALTLFETNPRQHVFLVCDFSRGADAIVGRAEFATLAELRGRRIAVEATALGAYMLARGLASAGLTARDVTVVPMTAEAKEVAFKAGRVDAVVTFDPQRSRLLAAGARQLFDSAQIPGEIVDVLIARQETIERRPKALAAIARGWFRGVEHLAREPRDAFGRIAARQGATPAEVEAMLRGLQFADRAENLRLLAPGSDALAGSFRRLAELMRENRLLTQPVDPERLPIDTVVRGTSP